MDPEEKKKRHKISVIIAETFMVVAVVAVVVIALFFSLGYNLNNGQIEQNGLLQLHSTPSGATVAIDGETIFPHTNLSRNLSPGEHTIKISRENYTTWSGTAHITSGELTRLFYPKLFLEHPVKTTYTTLPGHLALFEAAPDQKSFLYQEPGSAIFHRLDVSGDQPSDKSLDYSTLLADPNVALSDPIWGPNSDRLLLKSPSSWLFLDLTNPANSYDLTAVFGLNFEQLIFADSAHLFALENGNLRLLDLSAKTISSILATDVVEYHHLGLDLFYLDNQNSIYLLKENIETPVKLYDATAPTHFVISTYYDDKYLAVTESSTLKVFILTDELSPYSEKPLSHLPTSFSTSPHGEYLIATSDNHYSVFDLDQKVLAEYDTSTPTWLDNSLLSVVEDGTLTVFDYNHENQHTLATGLTSSTVLLSGDSRYLYYLVDTDLIRLQIQ